MTQPDNRPDRNHAAGFGARAELYARYRPGYPDALYDRLIAALPGPAGHVVDLGAGSGQASRALATRFARVTSIEPDARMVEQFPSAANMTIQCTDAEHADIDDGTADAVIAATSFHWMDQAIVCRHVARWLIPGGAFMPFLYGPFRVQGAGRDIFRRHAAAWGPFKDARLGNNVNYEKSIRESGLFEGITPFGSDMHLPLSPEQAAGLIMTFSYADAYARATYADKGGPAAYAEQLTADFSAADGELVFTASLGGVMARRASHQP